MNRCTKLSKSELTVCIFSLIVVNITSSHSSTTCPNMKVETGPLYLSFETVSNPDDSQLEFEISTIENYYEINPCTNYTLKVTNISSAVHFIIVQAHSYLYNVTLGYSLSERSGGNVVGKNIGLVHMNVGGTDTALFYLRNQNIFSVFVLVTVVGYGRNAPIPGGCNMEFELETSPFLKLNLTPALIQVDAQPAQIPYPWVSHIYGGRCAPNVLQYETYQLYLPSNDFRMDSYFKGISQMLTVKRIKEFGKKVTKESTDSKLRRLFNSYYGTGSIFALIVSAENLEYAAYVPIQTYSCRPEYNSGTCFDYSFYSILLSLLFGVVGIFLCFYGNECSRYETVVMFGLFGTFFCVILLRNLNDPGLSNQEIGLSFFIGIILSLFLKYLQKGNFGIEITAYFMDGLVLGILVVSVMFYTPIGDMPYYNDNFQYWILFLLVVLLITLATLYLEHTCDGFAPAIVGAYNIILCLEYFTHSNLRYIIINPIRRATVENFGSAAISPPYEEIDLIMVIIWVLLSIYGINTQPHKSFTSSVMVPILSKDIPTRNAGYGSCTTPDSFGSVFYSDNETFDFHV